jgi:DNA-binding NtrC family response regulator
MKKGIRKSILLVEDDELFRDALIDHLTDEYKVLEATTADEALGMMKKSPPDLALLDINLPDTDGVELLKRMKTAWPDLPVIMLTAIDRIPKVVESIKLGAYDYLTKPVAAQELLLSIARALESSGLMRELAQRRELQLAANREYILTGTSPAINKIRNTDGGQFGCDGAD